MIREGKTHQIPAFMDAGAKYGMQTMDKALVELYRRNLITRDILMMNAKKVEEVKRQISGALNTGGPGTGGPGGPPGARPPARL
jgi:Tfp pilus assembly pilus retraction ATPase PilT